MFFVIGSYRSGMTCRKDGWNDKEKQTRPAWHLEEREKKKTKNSDKQKVKIKKRTLTFSISKQQITGVQEIGCAHFFPVFCRRPHAALVNR